MGVQRPVWVLVVGILSVYSLPLAAQAKRPLKEIDLDLRGGIVNDVLPFDEKFIVTATIADTVNDVRAWVAATSKQPPRSEAAPLCPMPEDSGWAAIAEWRGDLPAGIPPVAAGTPRKFRLLFPSLEANGFYCVRFELGPDQQPPAAVLAAFREQTERLVDPLLRRYATGSTVPSTETIKLRRDLLASLRTLSGGLTPRGRAGSIFDATLPDQAVHRQMLDLVDPIVQAQSTRRSALGNLATAENALLTNAAEVERQSGDLLALSPQRVADLTRISGQDTLGSDLPRLQDWRANHQHDVKSAADALATIRDVWDTRPVDSAIEAVSKARVTASADPALVTRIRAAVAAANGNARADATAAVEARRTAAELDIVDRLTSARQDEIAALERASLGLTDLRGALNDRRDGLRTAVSDIEVKARNDVTLLVTSQGNFETRHGWYVSLDAGLAYGWDIDEAFGYLGTNIYFRPVNKDAPLQNFGNFRQSFSRRASALVGLTITGQVEEPGRREALVGGRILVLGGGIRMTDSIRLNGGVLVFKAIDPNPLVDERRVEMSPFVSMSYDIDVVGTLGDLGKAFGVGKPQAARTHNANGASR